MKIAIVVHGRFHAFDLARALLARGHHVTLFTNYPGWAVERFGISRTHVRSFVLHGGGTRVLHRMCQKLRLAYPEALAHQTFGSWAVRQLKCEQWDVIYCFSGIAEEMLQSEDIVSKLRVVVRGSSHIRTQARLLKEESERTGYTLDCPTPWIITREEREYQLADRIVVLSRFAYDSFIAEGVPTNKVSIMPLGSQIEAFRPSSDVVEVRCRRILNGEPLRILYVGTCSWRKGLWDMLTLLRQFQSNNVRFQFIGTCDPPLATMLRDADARIELIARQPQYELPQCYANSDIFIFPTIEDGFAVVLAQAYASALPILTTTSCAGPDMIREGQTGWILPIRTPEAFIERLRWCDAHRTELAEMVWRMYHEYQPRDWNDVAADFERICEDALTRMA